MLTVGVIGAGHVGCALAFDYASVGLTVILRALPGHPGNIPHVRSNDNILEATGKLSGRHCLQTSLDFDADISLTEDIIFVAVPSQGHSAALSELARHDLSQKSIIFITGNGVAARAGSLLNAKAICDTATSPYSSRLTPSGTISIRGIKQRLQIAALQTNLSELSRREIASVFRMPLAWSPNLLEVFLSGVNGVVHVPAALLNLGWIESTSGDFYFYRQGMSEGVCSIIDAADRERLAVAQAYDCKISSALETYNTNYGTHESRFRDFAHNADAHNRTKGAQKRFLSQDVPYWLVLCADLGKRAGVATPFIDSLILLASAQSGEDYLATGRTLKSLGLGGAGKAEILGAFRMRPSAVAERRGGIGMGMAAVSV